MTSGEGRPPRRHFNARMSVRFQPLTALTTGRSNLRTGNGPFGSGGARLGLSQKDGLPYRCCDIVLAVQGHRLALEGQPAGCPFARIHLAQAGQTVPPPPSGLLPLNQATSNCQISCDSSAMNCMNNCGLITGAQATTAPDFRAQCSLSCSSQQMVCKQRC